MKTKFRKIIKYAFLVCLYFFAFVGFVFTGVFFAMKLHLTDVKGGIDERNQFFKINSSKTINKESNWMKSDEWSVLSKALGKDSSIINKVSELVSLDSRVLVSVIVPEQMRFFTSNRESFKKYFEPLKILGNLTQFSYGVSGIKLETAKEIENHLKDKNSPYYLGESYENILDYDVSLGNVDDQRLDRLTSKDHYYSYLYTALFVKQVINQWNLSSVDIDDRPEVLATLFNLGFSKSIPKEDPDTGGSILEINGKKYTFGGIAYDFYHSSDLSNIFPIR